MHAHSCTPCMHAGSSFTSSVLLRARYLSVSTCLPSRFITSMQTSCTTLSACIPSLSRSTASPTRQTSPRLPSSRSLPPILRRARACRCTSDSKCSFSHRRQLRRHMPPCHQIRPTASARVRTSPQRGPPLGSRMCMHTMHIPSTYTYTAAACTCIDALAHARAHARAHAHAHAHAHVHHAHAHVHAHGRIQVITSPHLRRCTGSPR